jgi:hypothetical protein
VTLIEAQQVLGTFDAPLREYAANKLNKQGVHLMKVSSWHMTHAIQLLLMSAGVIAWHEAECAVQQDSIMRSAFALHTCAAFVE